METPTRLINETLEKVTVILDTAFPDYLTFENCTFTIGRGSTQVMIIIRPFNETDTCIECISNVVIGAKVTNDLMRFLLRKNAELHFGAFGLLFDDTVIFSHSIAGANVDMNELVTTIHSVAIIADYYDDEIVRMAGGKRAIDVGNSD